MYLYFVYRRRLRPTIGSAFGPSGCSPRHNGYNRNYRRPAVALSYRTTPDDTILAEKCAPSPTFSYTSYRSIFRHIVVHCRATKRITNYAKHLPLAPSGRIVHCNPLCSQIEWTNPYKRQRVWGGVDYPG